MIHLPFVCNRHNQTQSHFFAVLCPCKGSEFLPFDLDDQLGAGQSDHRFWVHELKNTYFGDANLDGEFDSADLVQVFKAGEYEDDVENNSGWGDGDWNADREFTSSDLVVAFQDGGYELGPRVVAQAVPEPSCLTSLLIGLLIVFRPQTQNLTPTRKMQR